MKKKSEKETLPEIRDLYIDIGAKDKDDALNRVSLGQYISFDTEAEILGEYTLKAKAIDDRAGCGILMELMKNPVRYDTYFCFTSQEEVGLRGATVAAHRVNPDACLVLESTSCNDVYECPEQEYVTSLGKGAAITFMDGRHIAPRDIFGWLCSAAKEASITVQLKRSISGGNDAGRIHLARGGVKTISVSVPTRYLHSPCSVASLEDIESAMRIGELFLDRIDEVI